MSLGRGPLRVVLLRSGGYDYAELDLQQPIHLVAGNNVGKTTLIAALQFLYIDDARQMHFAHDWQQTRRHYFPDSGSFVLFECMTPTGLQVFGLRGQGPVQGFEYDRFVYAGAYDRDDFLAERTPRAWDEVRQRLLPRDLRSLEPKHLRASLTGSGDAKGAPLGLVPLKRSGSYDSFRFLFRNLLRLSRIEQKQLKDLFIDISRPRLRLDAVDLRHDYTEMFARVEKDAQDVDTLREVAPEISALVSRYEERAARRGQLVATWRRIEQVLAAEQDRVRGAVDALDDRRAKVDQAIASVETRQAEANREAQTLGEQRGGLRRDLADLQELREKARGFVPELEQVERSRLQAALDDLVSRLAGAARADRRQVEAELRRLRVQIDRDLRLVERYADAVVTWLRTRSGLDDAALEDVFSVANPDLLAEIVGEGRVSLDDTDAAVALVRRVAAAFDAGGFSHSGVRVCRPPTSARSALADFQDIDVVRERMQQGRSREAELELVLSDLAERDRLEDQRQQVEQEVQAAKDRLQTWKTWQRRQPELEEVHARLAAVDDRSAELESRQHQLQEGYTRLRLERSGFDQEIRSLRDELRRQTAEVQRLSQPPLAWPEGELPEGAKDAGVDQLVRVFRQDDAAQRALDSTVGKLFAAVEHKTAGRHQGADEAETIARLQDELAALEERQRAVQELWTSLVDALRSAFKALLEAVDEVQREVSRLTTALGRRQVSNLERVELVLVKHRDILGRLTAVIDAEEAPLFTGPGGRARATRDVQSWLEQRSRIELSELFDLRFHIVDVRGQQKHFDSLSQIESQGTSTTIKVLVHLELLRTMLADDTVAVPFFLDEVATLDQSNLRALIDHATSMGFIPVVASPHASDCVDTIYFLRRSDGGLVLDETSRVVLRRETAHGD